MKAVRLLLTAVTMMFICGISFAATTPGPAASKPERVLSIGEYLPYVIGEDTKEIDRLTVLKPLEQAKQEKIFKAWYEPWLTDPNGDVVINYKLGEKLKITCPENRTYTKGQADDCNTDLRLFNKVSKQVAATLAEHEAARDKPVADIKAKIDSLNMVRAKTKMLRIMIANCTADNIMDQKACLDHLFDGSSEFIGLLELRVVGVHLGTFRRPEVVTQTVLRKSTIRKKPRHVIVVPVPGK